MNFEKYKYKSLNSSTVAAYNTFRNLPQIGKLCHAPFRSMRFSQSGKILACCYNRGFVLGKYPEDRLHDVWFGIKLNDFRNCIQHNDLTQGCHECKRRLEQGLFHLSGAYQYDYLAGYPESKYPAMLDFEISNACNLECIMCTGENSSSIRKNREGALPYTEHYDKNFVDQLNEFIPYLKEARFSGGEPFMIPLYYDIWERMISENPTIELSVLTNASLCNDRIKRLLESGNFNISVSLDSLQENTLQTIRKNLDYTTAIQNLEYYIELSRQKNRKFNLNVCLMPYNWKELPEIVSFCNEKKINLIVHTVVFPPAHSLSTLPSSQLIEIYQYLVQYRNSNQSEGIIRNNATYEQVILQIEQWIKESEKRENFQISYKNKSERELKEMLFVHLKKENEIAFNNIVSIIEESGLSEESRKKILMNLLLFSAELIIAELKHNEPIKIERRLMMFNY